MKILVFSDLHLEFRDFASNAQAVQAADVVVLAGDIHPGVEGIAWARKTFADKPVVYVAGNHEFYNRRWEGLLDQLRETAAEHDVHFLEDETATIEGVRFVGTTLWTDFEYFGKPKRSQCMKAVEHRLSDYAVINAKTIPSERKAIIMGNYEGKNGPDRWSRKLTAAHTLERHQASRAWLESEMPKGDPASTVVVTHHCPHQNSTATRYQEDPVTTGFCSRLPPELMSHAGLWIHGHTHDSCDYLLENPGSSTRVVCNPRGYPLGRYSDAFENPAFDSALLVEIAAPTKEVYSYA